MSTQPPLNPSQQGQPNQAGDSKAAPPAPDPKLADLQKKVEALEKTLTKEASIRRVRVFSFWTIAIVLVILWLIAWLRLNCGWWSHLLLVVAILTALIELWTRLRKSKNIDSSDEGIPKWDPDNPNASLAAIHLYVLQQAAKSIEWYWKNKGSKAFWSQVIRFSVWALAAVGGLLPIIGGIWEDLSPTSNLDFKNGLWASLFLGIAAALLGLDKGFGFSSGWARYVLTATNIRKALEEFRMDWTALRAKAENSLTADKVAPLIERARQFRSDIEALVLQETKDWVTEFQSTMAQMEKDITAQISSLKAQVDKTLKEKQDAATPSTLHVEVQSNGKTGPNTVQVIITDNSRNEIVKEMTKGFSWFGSLVPGDYLVSISVPGNTSISLPKDQLATLKPGDPAKTLTFAL
jgi:hypothetical protein